jgi:hypothetical protein
MIRGDTTESNSDQRAGPEDGGNVWSCLSGLNPAGAVYLRDRRATQRTRWTGIISDVFSGPSSGSSPGAVLPPPARRPRSESSPSAGRARPGNARPCSPPAGHCFHTPAPNLARNAFLMVDLGTRRRSIERQSSIRSAISSTLGRRPGMALFYRHHATNVRRLHRTDSTAVCESRFRFGRNSWLSG